MKNYSKYEINTHINQASDILHSDHQFTYFKHKLLITAEYDTEINIKYFIFFSIQVSQEERSIFWEVIVSVILRKKFM
jgi:hypothetical protein